MVSMISMKARVIFWILRAFFVFMMCISAARLVFHDPVDPTDIPDSLFALAFSALGVRGLWANRERSISVIGAVEKSFSGYTYVRPGWPPMENFSEIPAIFAGFLAAPILGCLPKKKGHRVR